MNNILVLTIILFILPINLTSQVYLQLNPSLTNRDFNVGKSDDPEVYKDDPYTGCLAGELELLFVTSDLKNATIGGGLEGYYNVKGFSTWSMIMFGSYNFKLFNKFGIEPRYQMNVAVNEFNFFLGGRMLYTPIMTIKNLSELNINNIGVQSFFYEIKKDIYDDYNITHSVGMVFYWKYAPEQPSNIKFLN
jgi:hypothetical protein